MKTLINQVLKFGIVGVLAAVIDFGTLILLTEVLNVHYQLSAALAYTIATIFNYLMSMRYVFTSKFTKFSDKAKEFLIFLVLSLVGLFINDIVLTTFVEQYHLHYILSKVIATAGVMVWNFVTRKLLLDKKQMDTIDSE